MAVQVEWRLHIILHALFLYGSCQGQMCTPAFPTTLSDSTDCEVVVGNGSTTLTRIIPEMNFTCFGEITQVRATGEFGTGERNTRLTIWREVSSQPGTYVVTSRTTLGGRGRRDRTPRAALTNKIYEFMLTEPISVEPGDVVGLQLPPENDAAFILYFNNSGGPLNYNFNGQPLTVSLNESDSLECAEPQISLKVIEVDIPATQLADRATSINTWSTGSGPSSTDTSNNGFVNNSTDDNPLTTIGSIVGPGGIVAVVLVVTVIVTLVLVYLSRKAKRAAPSDRETRVSIAQNIDAPYVGVEANPNLSYIPIFNEILTGNNAAYAINGVHHNTTGYLTVTAGGDDDIAESSHGNTDSHQYEVDYRDATYEYID